jgi:hypothetical protein
MDSKETKKEEAMSCREYQVKADCWVYRVIVGILGGVIAIALLGALYITLTDTRPVPDMFVAFGSGALGALAGLLAPHSADRVVIALRVVMAQWGKRGAFTHHTNEGAGELGGPWARPVRRVFGHLMTDVTMPGRILVC